VNGVATATAFDRFVGELERLGKTVRGGGSVRQAQCPGHDDSRPSLTVTRGADRVLVHCHGPCSKEDIAGAVGWTVPDLFDEPLPQRETRQDRWTPYGPWVARYPYIDAHGVLRYYVHRTADKQFPCCRPDPAARTGWRWNMQNTPRVLYRLPEVLRAADADVVWIVEGERDADRLASSGEVATTSCGGSGSWKPEYGYREALAGKDCLVVADKDAKGWDHAQQVLADVEPVARFAWIVWAAEGNDISDHLNAGYGIEEVIWWNR